MHKWTLQWKLPDLQCRLWLHVLLLLSGVCACDRVGEASVTDCSKHERHARNYDYMEGGDVRIRRLYSRTQWFLTVDEYGNINGTQDPNNCYSVLEIRTVSEGGVLAIKGLKSQYYISMNRTGILQGTVKPSSPALHLYIHSFIHSADKFIQIHKQTSAFTDQIKAV